VKGIARNLLSEQPADLVRVAPWVSHVSSVCRVVSLLHVAATRKEVMDSANLSRRSLLQAIAATIAATAAPIGWAETAHAMEEAHAAAQVAGDAKISLLSPAEAADIEAVAAQIIPTDDSPGAREAGVVYFIDRALSTFLSQLAGDYRAQLAAFQSGYREQHPAAVSFAMLTAAQQIEYLKSIDQTPFFNTTRLLTLLGMFSLPAYGGNRDAVGWKLIGFEDHHVFHPPFGYYDRGYPGFVIDPVNTK
jgi:gluconate 2-dehydrogenase gamma chain